jgi:nitrile hydratase subunit beta
MPRFSNVGGVQGFGPVDPTDDHRPFEWVWQSRVWAMNNVLPARFGHDTDEKRDLSEQLPATVQMEQGYYERWLTRLEILLVEDGVLQPGELDAAVAEAEAHAAESGGGHRAWHEEGTRPWATRYE